MARSLWVLIAAAGEPHLLGRTLGYLAAAEKPAAYRGTIIVENGPRSGIEQTVRSFPRHLGFQHRYVPEGNKSHALNCALAQLDGGLVFMSDDDFRFDPQILLAYDHAAHGIEAGACFGGPVLIDAEHGVPPAWRRRFYPLACVDPWVLPYETPTLVTSQFFLGGNWAAFAGDILAAGGFDTRLGPGGSTGAAGQETEAQRRLIARGARSIYVPQAVAWHYSHREFLDPNWILRRTYRHGLEWGIRRTRGKPSAWQPIVRAVLGRLNAHAKGLVLRASGAEARQFAAAFHEAKWRGRWDGLWLGRKWDSLPQLAPPAPLGQRHAA
jgi:GT2 family glycosyltransferase